MVSRTPGYYGRRTKNAVGVREALTAVRTYYVRTDGSDSNNGLVNTSGGAFLTIQKAVDVVASLDRGIYDVNIQVGAGTFSQGSIGLLLRSGVGSGIVTLIGDTATPSNVVITSTSGVGTIFSSFADYCVIRGFKITNTGTAHAIHAQGAHTTIGDIEFGSVGSAHIVSQRGAVVDNVPLSGVGSYSYTITGGGSRHLLAIANGIIAFGNGGVGEPASAGIASGAFAFSSGFAVAVTGAVIQASNFSYSGGTVTGTRYAVMSNAVMSVGGSASFFLGSVAGSSSTGGQYL